MSDVKEAFRPHPDRTDEAFEGLAGPLRPQLKLHCYRMLGSLHEAEDLVQETYLRAWRGFASFEGRGSFSAWLHQIATNACLNAIASRKDARRLLPDQRGPALPGMPDGSSADIAWLEPYPDLDLDGIADDAPDPEARYASREAVQLAFVAAIQQLPPRQRAALLLCDVLGWSAAEAATLLSGSKAAINSALQRARETLARHYPDGRASVASPAEPGQRDLLGRYVKAWEQLDLDRFVALLKEDATYTMPPVARWYSGRQRIGAFFGQAWQSYESFRLVPTAANRQPAFAAYSRATTAEPWRAHSIHVLALDRDMISRLTLFYKPDPRMFEAFRMPPLLEDPMAS